MSIEVPVLAVLGLADRLRAAAEHGTAASARLRPPGEVGALTAGLDDFVECFALAARAVGSETDLLGSEVAATARSWLALDAGLLARWGLVRAR